MLLKEFIKDNKVGAIANSSKFVIKQICDEIDFQKVKIMVELGPGNGVITKALLKKMRPEARLVVVEQNREFARSLTKINDGRLTAMHASAEKIKEILAELRLEQADCVISGIPFSMIKDSTGRQIIFDVSEILNENGTFIIYQFRDTVCKYLKAAGFERIQKKIEIINLPPVQIFIAKK